MPLLLLAAAEREDPAAGLKPRPPQQLVPRQLVFHLGFGQGHGAPVSFHSLSALPQDLSVARLIVGAQRSSLRGVAKEIEEQRRVVLRDAFPRALAVHGVVASDGSRRVEVGGGIVHLVDRVAWLSEHTSVLSV